MLNFTNWHPFVDLKSDIIEWNVMKGVPSLEILSNITVATGISFEIKYEDAYLKAIFKRG